MIKYLLIAVFSIWLTNLSGQAPSRTKNTSKKASRKASKKFNPQLKSNKIIEKDKPKKSPKEGKQIAIDEEGISEEHLNKKKKAPRKKEN